MPAAANEMCIYVDNRAGCCHVWTPRLGKRIDQGEVQRLLMRGRHPVQPGGDALIRNVEYLSDIRDNVCC